MEQGACQLVAQLYAAHAASLHRYLLLTGSQPADADELLQEGYLRLFRVLQEGEAVERPKAWLIRVLQNLRIETLRREKGRGTVAPEGTAQQNPLWTAPQPNPEEALIRRQRRERLEEAMQQLSEKQYRYVLLRAEGLTLREIAEMNGVALQSVAETCARAIERLGRLTHE